VNALLHRGLIGAAVMTLAALATAPAGLAAGGAAAAPTTLRIVALGDSYTAGNGAGDYATPDLGCHRSRAAYAQQLAALLRERGTPATALDVACSGAVVADITRPSASDAGVPLAAQLDQVPPDVARAAGLALVTIGGNDLRFVDTVVCLLGLRPAAVCDAELGAASADLPAAMARTRTALLAIAARLPRARIVLVGYPLLTAPACRGSRVDAAVAAAQRRLDAAQARVVAGHGPCAAPERQLVHGVLLRPLWASFHPNRAGHAATARLLLARVRGA
jgi:lysophospholipase L1-like esterase